MRILIAEDDLISQRVLQATLTKWGHEVIVANNGEEALEELRKPDAPKLAVLDWMMPKMDGPEVCRHARQLPNGEYFYFILLTAKGRKEDVVQGLDSGADDYVIKPFDSRELRVRIRCAKRIVDLQSELIAARDALHVQATHDSLTGVLNRAALYEAVNREIARAQRQDQHLAVVMVDLDHFKRVNDNYGHVAGDIVLVESVKRIAAQARSYDLVGRYGGEEFVIILPGADAASAAVQAERMRNAIASEPVQIGQQQLKVTASMGVSSTAELGYVNIDELVNAADCALYRAKNSGRNCVEVIASEAELHVSS